MRVLVIEDDIGSSTEIILDLVEAGHRVVRCQPMGLTVEPCAVMTGAACPLDEPVDVTVQVHDGDLDITMRELGAACAGRAGVPIVNVGRARSRVATVCTTADRLLETLAELGPRP
jgi:hypothetical protein